MQQAIKAFAWGIAGLTLTGALTLGAFAIAGQSLSSPSGPVKVVVPSLVPSRPEDPASTVDSTAEPSVERSGETSGSPTVNGASLSPAATDKEPRRSEGAESTPGSADQAVGDD